MKKFRVLFISVFLLFITGCESSIDILNNQIEGEIEYEIKGEKEVKEEKEEDHTKGSSIEDWEVDADSTLYELKPSGGGGGGFKQKYLFCFTQPFKRCFFFHFFFIFF